MIQNGVIKVLANRSGYCIYKDGASDDLSLEHIIPMSLGGHDSLSIFVDRKENNGPASTVDSGIANDFLMMFARRGMNAVGHSKKAPEPRVKNGLLSDGTKVQITFAKEGIQIFDARKRKYLSQEELPSSTFTLEGVTFDTEADIKFVAKTSLAAGMYVYGEEFRTFALHDGPRKIMHSDCLRDIEADVRLTSRFEERTDDFFVTVKAISERDNASCVLLMPGDDCLGVAVGILGTFMGIINIPAPGHSFSNEGDHTWGRAIFVRDGQLVEQSFHEACKELQASLEK